MDPVKITDKTYWVGAIDWDLRDFHGYTTERGSTYNAYIILDKEITLIDTVKHYKFDEMLSRIKKLVDPAKIKNIVSNHVEMDHSGSITKLLKIAKDAVVITNPQGEKGLRAHFPSIKNFNTIKNNDTFISGETSLTFVQTPMVHWPDNMVTYSKTENVLFSNDAFGQHIASFERFDYEMSFDETLRQAKKYYANIVMPYSIQVINALNSLSSIQPKFICPSHGVIWKDHIDKIMFNYKNWSENKKERKAVIVFDTMWGSTKLLANALYESFEELNIKAILCDLKTSHISDIMTEVLDAEYLCVGSPTLNKNMLPSVSSFLTYLKGLSPKGKKGISFGSFGWGGESAKDIDEEMRKAGFLMMDSVRTQYIPSEEFLLETKNKIKGAINDQ